MHRKGKFIDTAQISVCLGLRVGVGNNCKRRKGNFGGIIKIFYNWNLVIVPRLYNFI